MGQLLHSVSQKLRLMLTLTCSMVDMDWDIPATIIPILDMDLATMARGLLMLSLRLKLILTSSTVDITDLVMPDMVFIILPMVAMLIMERDLPMLSPRPMLTPTFFMVDTMVLDMDTTDIPMLTMARGLLTPSPRLKLILTSSMVDITDLVMPAMDFTILPMVVMLTMERDLPMLKPRLIPMCMVDTMDSVDTVVMVDMDLDVVSTLDKQRISSH